MGTTDGYDEDTTHRDSDEFVIANYYATASAHEIADADIAEGASTMASDSIHAQMCDLTLAERLGNHAVHRFEVNGIATYDDIRRIQSYADAQGRIVTWAHNRNGGGAVLTVVRTLDVGDPA